jgi:hypothetical protein
MVHVALWNEGDISFIILGSVGPLMHVTPQMTTTIINYSTVKASKHILVRNLHMRDQQINTAAS